MVEVRLGLGVEGWGYNTSYWADSVRYGHGRGSTKILRPHSSVRSITGYRGRVHTCRYSRVRGCINFSALSAISLTSVVVKSRESAETISFHSVVYI